MYDVFICAFVLFYNKSYEKLLNDDGTYIDYNHFFGFEVSQSN